MFTLVRIRLLQLKRQLHGAGLIYLLLGALVLAIIFISTYKQYQIPDHAVYVSVIILLLVLSIHFSRKDYAFVKKQMPVPTLQIFAEYACFVAPFFVPCLFTRYWYHFPFMIPVLYGIACLKVNLKQRTALRWLSGIIPTADFEWISGFRKSYALLLPLLLLSYLTTPWRILPLVFLWISMAGFAAFYQECESLQVLRAVGRDPVSFLHSKIVRHSRLLLLLFVPPLAINSVFNPEMIWINFAFLLLQWIVLLFAILLKYATYAPNELLKGNAVLMAIATMSAALPFLVPVPLLLSIRNYKRAISNLKNYLF